MTTLEDQLLGSLQQTVQTKGPTIELESDVLQTKKTPLTYDQMKEILETGGSIPKGFTLPTSMSMKEYASLPGGLSAYQNLQGMGMMEAIKGTAGFGSGPGGIDTDPNEPEETPPQVIAHNCPKGYVFDSSRQMCVMQPDEDDGPEYDDTQNSYNSFVEMVSSNPDFDGTFESFTENANNSWMGKYWTTFFNNDDMLYETINNILGPDIMYGGGGDSDFEGMPTSFTDEQILDYQTENQQEPDQPSEPEGPGIQGDPGYTPDYNNQTTSTGTIENVGTGMPGDPGSYDPPPSVDTGGPFGGGGSATGTFDSNFQQQVNQANQQAQDNDNDTGGTGTGTTFDSSFNQQVDQANQEAQDNDNDTGGSSGGTSFENVNSGGGDDFGYSGGFILNKGGFVEQAKPIQLDDVSLKMQEGGQVPIEGMPMDQSIPTEGAEGMPVPSGQPAGFVEDPSAAPAPNTPVDAVQGEGQKDDVMGELPEGTFVINAMAVQLAGIDELDKMVEEAYEALVENLKEKGVEVPLIQQLVDRSRSIGKVDVAVSNGEYIIPPELVAIIGEDRLRKINDRGLRKLEETKKTTEKQQAPAPMKEGGFAIATDPDGKILTEKIKDESGREVSRILSKDEVGSAEERATQRGPRDGGSYQDLSTKDINDSNSFVRRVTPDEIASNLKKKQEEEGSKVSGPDTPTTDYIVRSEDPEELRDAATYAERQDPEELRDSATYAERQDPEELRDSAEYSTRGKKRSFMRKRPTDTSIPPNAGDFNIKENMPDRLGALEQRLYPRELTNKPAGDMSLENALEVVQNLYDTGDYSGLLNIMIDQDGTFFNFPKEAKARAKDLSQQLLANKRSSPAKKLIDNSLNDEIKQFNKVKSFGGDSFIPAKDDTSLMEGQSSVEGFMTSGALKGIPIPQQMKLEAMDKIRIGEDDPEGTGAIQDDTDNQIDDYKYNDIKNTYEDFMKQSKGFKLPSLISTAQADEVQAASLYDPDYTIPRGLKLLPNKNLNVPEFLEVVYRLGESENASKEKFKDSYNGTSGGLFQLGFQYFAPKELIDEKNKQYNLNMKEEKLGKIPKAYRAKDIEEFYSPYYQRTMAMALLMDYLETYEGDPIKAIVAYNAGKTRADKLGPNNNFTDFERYVLANNPKDGKRIVRDAKRLVEKILPEQFNFPAKVVNMSTPEPKPKMRTGGFV
tara:strand:+ start:82 stop:3630 length:3549 start_codon:yes stop_codon:yes gene_type:complete